MDTKGGVKKSAAAGCLLRVLALRKLVAITPPLVDTHVEGYLNLLGEIISLSFGYSKQWHCTNDYEFVSLVNSKFPLSRQHSWQGFRISSVLSTKIISELGTKASPMGEWKRLRKIVRSFGGSGVPIADPLELTHT